MCHNRTALLDAQAPSCLVAWVERAIGGAGQGCIGRGGPPPPKGVALIFIPAGGGLPPGPPPSLPWTLSPPPPSTLIHLRITVLGTFFVWANFSSCAFGAPIAGFFGHSTVSFLPSVADTMSQQPISAFFRTPVQPCPRAKRNGVVKAILYFCFQNRWTGKKRQEAYNVAQKACSTLFPEHSTMCPPQAVTRHPTQILLVPLPVQKRMTLVSPAQVSPNLIDLR